MRAVAFFEQGGPEKIQIVNVPRPQCGPRQALIYVKACGLNYFDLQVLHGWTPLEGEFPFWGGADIAGVVAETGREVNRFEPGDKVIVNPALSCGRCHYCIAGDHSLCKDFGVLGDTVPGGLAELVAVDESNLLHLPDGFSFEEVAAVPLVFQTAWRALIPRARLRSGETILILGASGGVATAAIQIAKLAGATVFAVTSSPAKMELVQQLGADVCLNRNNGDYWSAIADMTHRRGVDVVLESVGQATWQSSLQSLAKGGRMVTIGRTTGDMGPTEIKRVFWNQLQIIGSTMANRGEFSDVMELVFQRKLHPVIDSIFPMEKASQAYARLMGPETFGKVIITIGQ